LYRRSAEEIGDGDTRDLLEDVERVLVEIANGPEVVSSNDLSEVRARITDQDLIFRLRVMTAEMQARERRARPTW
jgi:small-conductance mechanosensitive channel